jgi:hypothetical protein
MLWQFVPFPIHCTVLFRLLPFTYQILTVSIMSRYWSYLYCNILENEQGAADKKITFYKQGAGRTWTVGVNDKRKLKTAEVSIIFRNVILLKIKILRVRNSPIQNIHREMPLKRQNAVQKMPSWCNKMRVTRNELVISWGCLNTQATIHLSFISRFLIHYVLCSNWNINY